MRPHPTAGWLTSARDFGERAARCSGSLAGYIARHPYRDLSSVQDPHFNGQNFEAVIVTYDSLLQAYQG